MATGCRQGNAREARGDRLSSKARWALALLLGAGLLWAAHAADPDHPLINAVTGSTRNPYYDPAKPHHTPNGFRNLYGGQQEKGLGEVIAWQMSRRSPRPPLQAIPTAAPQLDTPEPSVTWLGHASSLLHAGGLRILMDPQFSERASPLSWAGPKRLQPPPLQPAQLPHVDVVLISHNHYDHLDEASVKALAAQAGGSPLFIVPLGIKPWLEGIGIRNARELDWWESHRVGAVEFVITPVQHWSSRTPWDRRETLWGGWALFAPNLHAFFSGDTGYSADFKAIREHFARQGGRDGFDLALLPIGCYEPRSFMKDQHVNPEEAVRMHLDLGARHSIGVHWGTFQDLCDEPLDQAPVDLALARRQHGVADGAFETLAIGQTKRLGARP